jgi:hypothetical protein
MTPKGNSRANGISKRESNNEANCEADCNIARHNLAGGGDGGRKSPEHLCVSSMDAESWAESWDQKLIPRSSPPH